MGGYVINLDAYKSQETHWMALYGSYDNVTYFHSYGVQHISKKIKKIMGNRNIVTNIEYKAYKHYRIQAHKLKMFRYSCIRFIDFILKGKSFLTNMRKIIK